MLSVKQGGIKYHFFLIFGMTRPRIKPQSPRPLTNTQLIRPTIKWLFAHYVFPLSDLTQSALKVMPPDYFHENYNRYKTIIGQSKFFLTTKHCFFSIEPMLLTMHFHCWWTRVSMPFSQKFQHMSATNFFYSRNHDIIIQKIFSALSMFIGLIHTDDLIKRLIIS